MKTISITELKSLQEAATLLHVLPEDHFEREHLPRALNACVYETIFPSKVAELVPDKTSSVIVYGAGGDSLDAATAAEKLTKAGYTNVSVFPGGISEWRQNNLPLEGTHAETNSTTPQGHYDLDTETSVVRWTGRNLFNHHQGTLKLSGGHIEVQNGVLQSARFTIDMNTIACEDLVDTTYNAMLIRHLRDDDFFSVDRFPTAEFICDRADPLPSCTPGTPNYTLHGTMTLRGVTQPLSFPAVIAAADADHLTGQAQFELDRTQFGSHYGSGRLFAFLGKHVVNDHVHLHLKLHTYSSHLVQ
ncbi:MAG: YceI family protein [Prosthecobacter sp.]|uniref:YceI family protein n=1 Tax=Prosthecobacter sp. TaxID=1965333 RepID=UPI00260EA84D|nr:YceI family protein [Prosthecobacter sp.]MCF7789228.1 YceI family protein [Prosthecobacter sp.]